MKKRPLAVVCLVISIFLFLVTKLVKVSPPIFMEWEGKRVTVLGEVYEKESYWKADKEVSVVYLRLKAVWCNGKQAEICTGDYRAICYLKENQILPKTGSIIRIVGIMQGYDKATNPGQFDAESYYQILKISFRLNQAEIQQQSQTYHKIKEALYQIRCRCASVFDAILAPEDSSVMKTMLLGEKKAVDERRKELYQKNGIAHILAISGVKTLKLDIPLVPETRINWAFVPLHIAIIYILKLCLNEEIIPRCRFPCSRGYRKKYINWQKKQ